MSSVDVCFLWCLSSGAGCLGFSVFFLTSIPPPPPPCNPKCNERHWRTNTFTKLTIWQSTECLQRETGPPVFHLFIQSSELREMITDIQLGTLYYQWLSCHNRDSFQVWSSFCWVPSTVFEELVQTEMNWIASSAQILPTLNCNCRHSLMAWDGKQKQKITADMKNCQSSSKPSSITKACFLLGSSWLPETS